MNILITGGVGFIGQHLARALSRFGHSITMVDSSINRLDQSLLLDKNIEVIHRTAQRFFSELLTIDRIPIMKELIDANTAEYDVVFDLAARARIGASLENPEEFITNNVGVVMSALSYCRQHPNARYVLVSSSSVKFSDLTKNPYALSKKMGEDVVTLFRELYGVQASIVRLFNVYGPGEMDYGKHTTLIKACKKAIWNKSPIFMNGDGAVSRDFTHVFDVVDGLISIMNDENLKPLYELGSGKEPVSVKAIIDAFTSGTDIQVIQKPPRDGDAPLTKADSKLFPPGWSAKTDVLNYIHEWKTSGCPID